MRILTIAVLFSSLLFAAPLMAGAGHDHDHGHSHGPVSSDEAVKKASKRLGQLVDAGKIDESWSVAKTASVEKKTYANGLEWVVSFVNDKISDASKQTLYIFYSLDGHYIAANYTGN